MLISFGHSYKSMSPLEPKENDQATGPIPKSGEHIHAHRFNFSDQKST